MASDHQHQHADHPHAASFTEQNRAHWDNTAKSYDSQPWQKDMLNKIHEFMLANISWIGVNFNDPSSAFETGSRENRRTVKVLDYACGPGSITNVLRSHATNFIGIDLSEKMVEMYNERFDSENEDRDPSAHAMVGNLLDPTDPDPKEFEGKEFFDFDLVVIGLGFHHFENLREATSRLVQRLKSGGVFLIVDFVTHAEWDDGNPATHTIAHNGFNEEEVQQIFGSAGLVDIDVVVMAEEIMMRGTTPRTVFMGKGRKA